MSQLIIER